jgi:hypothetical protein
MGIFKYPSEIIELGLIFRSIIILSGLTSMVATWLGENNDSIL